MIIGRTCNKCHIEKPWADFYSISSGRLAGKKQYRCKACYAQDYQKRVRPKVLALRQEILNAFGRACVCCGETTEEFLALDHKHNDGADERRRLKIQGHRFYQHVKQCGFPKDRYQLLCHNCNFSKGRYGQCPHELLNQNAFNSLGG